MNERLKLHEILCGILGSTNVYFQPPESVKLHYPVIIYELDRIEDKYADNNSFYRKKAYSITLIHKDPDNGIVDKIKDLKFCRFDRFYVADNLNHYVYTLYF